MCKCNCEHPDRKPAEGNCTVAQIKICHGDNEKFILVTKKKQKRNNYTEN